MPITKSAKKALRQTKRRTLRNLQRSETYKNAIKDFRKLIGANDQAGAKKLLPSVYKAIDKAAKSGVIKANAAARKKSQAARLIAR